MKRFFWILRAWIRMYDRCAWASWDMCASLYEHYVIDDPESEWSPADAVDEDISYWGE